MNLPIQKKDLWLVIAVGLGYFMDLYDLFIFSSVKTVSLTELGIVGKEAIGAATTQIMNWTVAGMLLGGIGMGIAGDKWGRKSLLLASIIIYSLTTAATFFVDSLSYYTVVRFLTGIGIAGELGLGITLATERLPKEQRTYATMTITALGMLGAVTAGVVANLTEGMKIGEYSGWRFAYLIGGCLGLGLILFRSSILESKLYEQTLTENKGNLLYLVSNPNTLKKYIYCVLTGLPMFFIIAELVSKVDLFAQGQNPPVMPLPKASTAIIFHYISISISDVFASYLSRLLKSRKKVLALFLLIQAISIAFFLFVPASSDMGFYFQCVLLGIGIGNWGVLTTNAAEQFGTNLRATVATSVPNVIRALLIPMTLLFYKPLKGSLQLNVNTSAFIVLGCSIVLALFAVSQLEERFEIEADFEESNK